MIYRQILQRRPTGLDSHRNDRPRRCRWKLSWIYMALYVILMTSLLMVMTSSPIWVQPNFVLAGHDSRHSDVALLGEGLMTRRTSGKVAMRGPGSLVVGAQEVLASLSRIEVKAVNCSSILNRDLNETGRALQYQQEHPKVKVADASYVESARDCATFRRERGYISSSLTGEERDFPLAYSIVMYKDVEQTERLLRAIYRPQNYYCIHVDAKSTPEVQDGVRAIVSCFDNVMVSSKSTKVAWGTYSVLEADLFCMEDLLKMSSKWKYFINLTGQEWPLKTNLELTRILRAVNGTNLIIGSKKGSIGARTKWQYKRLYNTGRLKSPPPEGVTLCKGPLHVAATRGYVNFIFNDARGRAFLSWVNDTGIPDETFFASLNHSPDYGVPGAYRGVPEMHRVSYPNWIRFKVWQGTAYSRDLGCGGSYKRSVCVFGLPDLPNLQFDQRRELFLNKIHLDRHPLLLDCLEEYTQRRTRHLAAGRENFRADEYRQFEVTWNHNPS